MSEVQKMLTTYKEARARLMGILPPRRKIARRKKLVPVLEPVVKPEPKPKSKPEPESEPRFSKSEWIDWPASRGRQPKWLPLRYKKNTVLKIQRVVGDYYGVSRTALLSYERDALMVLARHVAMYLTCKLLLKTMNQVGMLFAPWPGRRDHTSILHACRKITKQISNDPEFAHQIAFLENCIKEEIDEAIYKDGYAKRHAFAELAILAATTSGQSENEKSQT